MNLRLTNVLSDITGITGMKIIRAIVAGQHDPIQLARFRDGHCTKSEEAIQKSLEGNYKREHLFALQPALELYDFYGQQLQKCDQELETLYDDFEPPDASPTPPPTSHTRKRRKNQPHFDLTQALFRMTGGKVKRSSTPPTQNRASTAFRMAAQSLAKSHCALGAD